MVQVGMLLHEFPSLLFMFSHGLFLPVFLILFGLGSCLSKLTTGTQGITNEFGHLKEQAHECDQGKELHFTPSQAKRPAWTVRGAYFCHFHKGIVGAVHVKDGKAKPEFTGVFDALFLSKSSNKALQVPPAGFEPAASCSGGKRSIL
jgi:hypothetical protein